MLLSPLLLLTALLGCEPTPSVAPVRPAEKPAQTLAQAPDQFACSTDQECVLAPWHFADHPCCNAPYTQVQAAAFVTWRDDWQAQRCADVDCAPVLASLGTAPPSLPMACYFEPRCTAGRCGGSCEAAGSPMPGGAP